MHRDVEVHVLVRLPDDVAREAAARPPRPIDQVGAADVARFVVEQCLLLALVLMRLVAGLVASALRELVVPAARESGCVLGALAFGALGWVVKWAAFGLLAASSQCFASSRLLQSQPRWRASSPRHYDAIIVRGE